MIQKRPSNPEIYDDIILVVMFILEFSFLGFLVYCLF
jgi:hypothetical protein